MPPIPQTDTEKQEKGVILQGIAPFFIVKPYLFERVFRIKLDVLSANDAFLLQYRQDDQKYPKTWYEKQNNLLYFYFGRLFLYMIL
jgi:hypothetical protein